MIYTKSFLKKIENLLKDTGFKVRYEKGTFQTGQCLLKKQKVVVLNKFFTMESKIESLIKLITEIDIKTENLSKDHLIVLSKIRSSK